MDILQTIEDFKKELSDIKLQLKIMHESNKQVWKNIRILVKVVQKSYLNVIEATKLVHEENEDNFQDLANSVSNISWG